MQENIVKPEIPLADEHTAHEKWIWDFCMTEIMATECVLEGSLRNLFAVLMSLCDSDTKIKLKQASPEYEALEMNLDSMELQCYQKTHLHRGH